VLDESPVRVLVVIDGAIDQGVSQGDREGDVLLSAVTLPGVEDDIAGTGRAAAATVVVPEAWLEAFRDSRDAQRVQAGQLQLAGCGTADGGNSSAIEGCEQQ